MRACVCTGVRACIRARASQRACVCVWGGASINNTKYTNALFTVNDDGDKDGGDDDNNESDLVVCLGFNSPVNCNRPGQYWPLI